MFTSSYFRHEMADLWRESVITALFAATILCILLDALPILTAAILALAIAVLTGTLAPAQAYQGFSQGVLLLIVAAFLIARCVINSGLGRRIGHLVVARFGAADLVAVFRERHEFAAGHALCLQAAAKHAHVFDAASGKSLRT